MYNASAEFNAKIKSSERMFEYSGKITTANGDEYTYGGGDIRSGKIIRAISGNSLEVGTVYASEYDVVLGLNVSRYELYGATITLNIKLDGVADIIPMGEFVISEITQTSDRLQIKAYDVMTRFEDVDFIPASNTNIQDSYTWISDACTACGVTLGSTSGDIKDMPNGSRLVGYADVASDVKTWRDVLGYITALLGGYAYIGRDGYLYIGQYGSNSADTVPSNFRYTSNLSDYKTSFNGIYSVFKEDGVQEYTSNENEDGLVLDLGTNPFMQFTKDNNRLRAMQEIIDVWNGLYYVPYEADMPLVPTYDPGDVLTFTDNQAQNDIGAITEIVYNIGGQMNVRCSGDNPRLASAQDRFAKSISGLSSEYSNTRNVGNRDFWIISTTNTNAITVGSTEIQISEIEWQQNTYYQDIEMLLTIDAVLSATANVQIRLNVDDAVDYEMLVTESKSLVGERVFHCTNPQKVTGTGTHTAKVYMTVTDIPLKVGDLV